MVPDDVMGATAELPAPLIARPVRTGRVFFLGDAMDSLDKPWDSSLRMMEATRMRGFPVSWASYDDILICGRTLVLNGMAVRPDDLVWLRLDPSISIRFYETLRALCHVDARFVNRPETVLTVHDKRSALSLCPRPTWSLFSATQVAPVAAQMREMGVELVVLKPPSLYGSKGVRFVPADDLAALEQGFNDLIGLFGYVIAEPYLGPGGGRPPIDMRVLLTPRQIVGAIEREIPVGGGLQDVVKAGPFTPAQAQLVDAAMDYLDDNRIFLAGLDFLGDTLTEINVSCPGAIPEINMFCDVIAEDLIVDEIMGDGLTRCGATHVRSSP